MKRNIPITIVLICAFQISSLNGQNVEVLIKGIKSDKGQIVIGVFKDQETFHTEKAFLSKSFPKSGIDKGEMKIQLALEPDIYGLTLLDDENMNSLMEYNFLGIPREGFGFSGYWHTGVTKPKFDDFSFSLKEGEKKNLTIRIRYF